MSEEQIKARDDLINRWTALYELEHKAVGILKDALAGEITPAHYDAVLEEIDNLKK